MSDYVSMTAFAVAYDNVDDAEANYKAVKDLYYDLSLTDIYGAAVRFSIIPGRIERLRYHAAPQTASADWRIK